MGIFFRRAAHLPAAVAFAVGVWGTWTYPATSEPNDAVLVDVDAITHEEIEQLLLLGQGAGVTEQAKANFHELLKFKTSDVDGDAITHEEVEQRARLLGLSVNLAEQAKANFQQLLKSRASDLEEKMKALSQEVQREVITGNPGKSREELMAIFKERMQERQKVIGKSLQKEAVEAAREEHMPKLRKDAKEQLIDERLKLQAAKKGGIEVSDADAKALVGALAARNGMTYEQFAQHLKGMGVDIATLTEKFRAQKAWRELLKRKDQ